jgi:transcriptional regulator with XRE-family HTH domain
VPIQCWQGANAQGGAGAARKRARAEEGGGLKDQRREAIRASGESLQELGRRSGVKADRLSRFLRGERGLSLDAVEDICKTLGLRLVASQPTTEEAADGAQED